MYLYKSISDIFVAYLFQFIIIYPVLAWSWKCVFLGGGNIASSCSLNMQIDTTINVQYLSILMRYCSVTIQMFR